MNDGSGRSSGCLAVVGLIVSVLYLSNLSMGIVELPDNLPLIGNLDEVFFSGILFASLARLGIRIPWVSDRFLGPYEPPRQADRD
jgi:hypothetical protein